MASTDPDPREDPLTAILGAEANTDPYTNAGRGVLKNRLGITDSVELTEVEATFSYLRGQQLRAAPLPGNFDLDHLKAIHKHLFGDVYEWAGEIRAVDIAKGNTLFALAAQIEAYAPKITEPLAREDHLRGLDPDTFADRAGYYMGELNVLHPFREGNGRALRAFMGQLACQAGYDITWRRISRDHMIRAVIEATNGDHSQLSRLIRDSLVSVQGRDQHPTPIPPSPPT